MNIPIEKTRAAWQCAASFSADKEAVYREHAWANEFDQHHGKDVFEYGCGGGSDAMSWLRRDNYVTYADVVPFNVTAASHRILSAGLAANARPIILENSFPIPVEDDRFDVVSSHGVLHHIVDPAPVMQEFHRMLRPGGIIYIMLYTEMLRARLDARVCQLVTWKGLSEEEAFCWLTDEAGCPYARPYTVEEGEALLRTAGFQPIGSKLYNNDDFRTFKGTT